MKILNLDSLAKTEGRQLIIFGKAYDVQGMTVGNFVETTKAAELLVGEVSLAKQVEATIDLILRSVPTVERSELDKLELPQLQAIVQFIRGDDVEGVETKEAGEGAGEKK